MKKQWIGKYKMRYDEYLSYRNDYVTRTVSLGYCLGNGDAFSKACQYLINNNVEADPASIVVIDGWNNEFKA